MHNMHTLVLWIRGVILLRARTLVLPSTLVLESTLVEYYGYYVVHDSY